MAAGLAALILRTLVILSISAVVKFAFNLYRRRTQFRSISSKYGLPLLPHSFVFGHLIISAKVAMKYPQDIAVSLIPFLIAKEYPEIVRDGYYYLDIWPISDQMISVTHPDIMAQIAQDPSLPKHSQMPREFGPFTNARDLVSSNGQIWKTWRKIFSPGFSAQNVQAYIPAMLEEYNVFRSKLELYSTSGTIVKMDQNLMALTTDIIGHAVLGARLRAQSGACEVFEALKRQIALLVIDYSPLNIMKLLNPLRPLKLWNNNRIMRKALLPYILECIRDRETEGIKTITKGSSTGSLAANSYRKEFTAEEGEINEEWIDTALQQFKMFIFAGHDTTGSTICFILALLQANPAALAGVRSELDSVFGPNTVSSSVSATTDPAQALLMANPELLNNLPYLAACIKETLRLFGPVSGTVRQSGSATVTTLQHPDRSGGTLPIFPETMLFVNQAHLHHDATWWPEPNRFVPERFLAKPGEEWYPRHKYAFRPFELGQRNCIGQEFAMVEMRLVVALCVREWDFEVAFKEEKKGHEEKLFGSRLWQVTPSEEITMHPRQGMPMRVRRRQS